ncbi:MAG: M23 family metallopeptidase [Cytophagales bacterium]|nr:M23 family metallopeptidase [Cytophagales bacterium]MDW8384846.1 M23 family metallopeptidase [Flammeovirgaceae bacterium]
MKRTKLNFATISQFLTNPYVLIIRDEMNLAEKGNFHFNFLKAILAIITLFTLTLIFCFVLITTALKNIFDPRVERMRSEIQLIFLEKSLDSLRYEIELRDKYLQNLKEILLGDTTTWIASAEKNPSKLKVNTTEALANLEKIDPIDTIFRRQFEDIPAEPRAYVRNQTPSLAQQFFFPPIIGIVSSKFDISKKHYGVDIVSKLNEPIKSIAEGTVILASWTQDGGYTISIQHQNDLVSVYKHNAVLLKEVGDFVKAGDLIGILGNSGELTDGPHLHLEIWHQGNPVDPQDFVYFN